MMMLMIIIIIIIKDKTYFIDVHILDFYRCIIV